MILLTGDSPHHMAQCSSATSGNEWSPNEHCRHPAQGYTYLKRDVRERDSVGYKQLNTT